MRSPFYSVSLAGIDISDHVESLHYEDTTEQDSMVELRIRGPRADELLAQENVCVQGSEVLFSFGYAQGLQSPQHRAGLTDIETRYGADGTSLMLRALDKGTVMKKITSPKVWSGSSKDICNEIARLYGLRLDFQEQAAMRTWNAVPQAHMSDFEFLQWLAGRETGGTYVCYLRGDTLHFVTRAKGTSSEVTYEWPSDGLISVDFSWRESTTDGSSDNAGVEGFDEEAGEGKTTSANSETEADKGKLGENIVKLKNGVYDLGLEGTVDAVKSLGKTFLSPDTEDEEEDEAIGGSAKAASSVKVLTASLRVLGDPMRRPNTVITLSGVAQRYAGNWLVTSVTHRLGASGYDTELECAKDGTKLAGEKTKGKANTSAGNASGNQSEPIIVIRDGKYYEKFPSGEYKPL